MVEFIRAQTEFPFDALDVEHSREQVNLGADHPVVSIYLTRSHLDPPFLPGIPPAQLDPLWTEAASRIGTVPQS